MQITRGKQNLPQRVVIYGPEGIGKTTLAAQFPGAVFIDTEGSTRNFDVARYPVPYSWASLLDAVNYAWNHPEVQKTLVIDTADWAERLCTEAVCQRGKVSGIEDYGYGKGYVYLKEEFSKLLTQLDGCIDNGIHVVLTAHAWMRKVEQPDEMGSYDHWELKLSKQCAPMVKEWADMVLFCNYRTIVVQDKNGKGKAQGGQRVMYTSHHPCWDAKNRHGLPPELPMAWESIAPIFTPAAGHPAQSVTVPVNPPAVGDVPAAGQTDPVAPNPQPGAPMPTPATGGNPIPLRENTDLPFTSQGWEGIDPALVQLMQTNGVTPEEICLVVGGKGYFPADMPVREYPPEFVKGCLIGAWPQVFAEVEKDRKELPF